MIANLVWTASNLLVSLTCLALLVILIVYGTKRIHYVWAFFNLVVCVWGFGGFLVGLARDSATALIFWKIGMLGSVPSPAVFYHVVVVLGNLKRKSIVLLFYCFSAIFYILFVFDLLGVKVVYLFNALYYIKATDYRFLGLCILWIGIIAYTIIELYALYRKSTGRDRTNYKYVLIGFLVGFTGAVLDALPMIGCDIFPIANAVMSIYSVIFTYAILRHKLLDVQVIIKKTIVFAGLLASVFAILIIPTLITQEYLFRSTGFGGRLIGLGISGIIIIVTMRRIENSLVNITDTFLFQKKYDYKALLKTFTSEVLTVLSLDKLINLTVDKIADIMKIDSTAVLLFDEAEQRFTISASKNLKNPAIVLGRSDDIVVFFEHTHGYLSKKELVDKKIYLPAHVQDLFDKLNAELMIPMILQGKATGILVLGKKKSDEDFTQDDLDILLPLARTLAIAISNAQLFAELGKTQAEAAQKEKMAVIGTLSAGINHEICNPLGIARGQCEAFLLNIKDGLYDGKSPDELLEKSMHIMEMVIKEVDRATIITKKLSTFAKPAKGQAESVCIDKEVDYVLSLVGHELKLEKIEFEKDIPPDLPDILVDRKQFQEVLFNLIRNAGQAIAEKGKICVSARYLRSRVRIDISDTGSGIPEDKIKELFNPFFTTKDPDKGTGLGLFIVRQVVEKNHGNIHLKETAVGRGTTFTIDFPSILEKVEVV